MPLITNKTSVGNATTPQNGLERLFREKEVASILGISVATLQRDRWAAKKEGTPPKVPFLKLMNGSVRYHPEDIRTLIESGWCG